MRSKVTERTVRAELAIMRHDEQTTAGKDDATTNDFGFCKSHPYVVISPMFMAAS